MSGNALHALPKPSFFPSPKSLRRCFDLSGPAFALGSLRDRRSPSLRGATLVGGLDQWYETRLVWSMSGAVVSRFCSVLVLPPPLYASSRGFGVCLEFLVQWEPRNSVSVLMVLRLDLPLPLSPRLRSFRDPPILRRRSPFRQLGWLAPPYRGQANGLGKRNECVPLKACKARGYRALSGPASGLKVDTELALVHGSQKGRRIWMIGWDCLSLVCFRTVSESGELSRVPISELRLESDLSRFSFRGPNFRQGSWIVGNAMAEVLLRGLSENKGFFVLSWVLFLKLLCPGSSSKIFHFKYNFPWKLSLFPTKGANLLPFTFSLAIAYVNSCGTHEVIFNLSSSFIPVGYGFRDSTDLWSYCDPWISNEIITTWDPGGLNEIRTKWDTPSADVCSCYLGFRSFRCCVSFVLLCRYHCSVVAQFEWMVLGLAAPPRSCLWIIEVLALIRTIVMEACLWIELSGVTPVVVTLTGPWKKVFVPSNLPPCWFCVAEGSFAVDDGPGLLFSLCKGCLVHVSFVGFKLTPVAFCPWARLLCSLVVGFSFKIFWGFPFPAFEPSVWLSDCFYVVFIPS